MALDALRLRAQRALKDRVAGGDAASQAEREERIWFAPGERTFAPDDPIWRAHHDGAMFVGGIAALLLQSLHPLAMAGVAGHSGFRGDPWGRLNRTADWIAVTTYAPTPAVDELAAHVRAVHTRVRGSLPDGRRYAASDPHLLRWVHVAETHAFLSANAALAADPLTGADVDRYVAQIGTVSALLGVRNPPQTRGELDSALAAYRDELEATPAALDAAAFLLDEPPLTGPARLGYAALAGAAQALTPAWAREMLGRSGSPARDRARLVVGRAATAGIRWAIAPHPATLPR